MDGKDNDRDGERTFRVNFSDDGASKLALRLTDALKEYMGEFVDDTLVEYVIVLLGNGRRKEEVREELDVFLGDKSDSFVAWLWDHLASNLNQYVGAPQPSSYEVAKPKSELVEHTNKGESEPPVLETDGMKPSKTSRSRLKRDWKGLVTETSQHPPLRSSIVAHIQNEEKVNSNALHPKQSVSPQRPVHRKRNRSDEQSRPKRDSSQANIAAPRRLLQFAVRDAVATTRPSNSISEPSQKRLRSVVSTSTVNITEELNHKRIQSVSRMPNPMATAIRAVEEASRDVRRGRTGNVFDRLSRGDGSSDQVSVFKETLIRDDVYDDYDDYDDHIQEKVHQSYLQTRNNTGLYDFASSIMDSSTGLASDYASDNEGYDDDVYDDVDVGARGMDVSQTGTSNKADESLMVDYSVAKKTDEMMRQSLKREQDLSVSAPPNTKHKIVNISVNVNTWKPPHYQAVRETPEIETPTSTKVTDIGAYSNVQVLKENSKPASVLGNGKPTTDTVKENQKIVGSSTSGTYSTGQPLEDADLRTIFVNNVHFAATKDSLSRHFNKFGEVLKVIILTDVATGHPKGSAYVEFMRKEAAENALTLDGTSFMSRIIKVVKKSSVQPEANITQWPRVTRRSPFGVPRLAQSPFPRVFPSAYRARPPMKLGARSMQWKRDTQPSSAENLTSNPGSNINSVGRGLTYIRSDTK